MPNMSNANKIEAERIRNIWRKERPEGLSKNEVETMPDSHVLDLNHILNEDLDDIFDNAEEIRFYEIGNAPTCTCCGKKMRKVKR